MHIIFHTILAAGLLTASIHVEARPGLPAVVDKIDTIPVPSLGNLQRVPLPGSIPQSRVWRSDECPPAVSFIFQEDPLLHAGVHFLSPDHMPCIVPDLSNLEAMPVKPMPRQYIPNLYPGRPAPKIVLKKW